MVLLCVVASAEVDEEAPAPETGPNVSGPLNNAPLRVGDVVQLTVWNEPDLNVKAEVNDDGTVVFPYIGPVMAAGKRPAELKESVTKKYADGYLVDPQVYISVASRASSRVYVVGSVGSPGVYDLAERTTLLELLARCGGASGQTASEVIVIRQEPPAEPEEGAAKSPGRVRVDLSRLLRGDLTNNLVLRNRDVILFPQSRASVERIFILGDISKKGAYPLEEGMSLARLLASIGMGPSNKKAQVTILRETPEAVENHSFSVHGIFHGKEAADFELKSGDVVNVEKESDVYYVVGEVNGAGAYRFQEGLTVREALILAGWITRRGNLGNIKVMRQIDGEWKTEKVELTNTVKSGDVIKVEERWF
jgi:polysaccharide export outer membrane protein